MSKNLVWKTIRETQFDPTHDYYWRGKDDTGKGELWPGQEIIDACMSQGSRFPACELLYADAGVPSDETIAKRKAAKQKKKDDWNRMIQLMRSDMRKEDMQPEKVAQRRAELRKQWCDNDDDAIEHQIFLAEEKIRNLKEILEEHKNK